MPITSSAKKALRASKKKRVYNVRHRDAMLSVVKEVRSLAAAKKGKDAMKLLPKAYAEIDKAAKTGFIKKNAASRKKSRLAALVKKSV
ncbi:MAG: 30S ribosomal protein S20 [Candidatus Paceibacterota bacterium]|jgi:small subunit ribosomal protein S20